MDDVQLTAEIERLSNLTKNFDNLDPLFLELGRETRADLDVVPATVIADFGRTWWLSHKSEIQEVVCKSDLIKEYSDGELGKIIDEIARLFLLAMGLPLASKIAVLTARYGDRPLLTGPV